MRDGCQIDDRLRGHEPTLNLRCLGGKEASRAFNTGVTPLSTSLVPPLSHGSAPSSVAACPEFAMEGAEMSLSTTRLIAVAVVAMGLVVTPAQAGRLTPLQLVQRYGFLRANEMVRERQAEIRKQPKLSPLQLVQRYGFVRANEMVIERQSRTARPQQPPSWGVIDPLFPSDPVSARMRVGPTSNTPYPISAGSNTDAGGGSAASKLSFEAAGVGAAFLAALALVLMGSLVVARRRGSVLHS